MPEPSAFVLRLNPNGRDRMQDALRDRDIIIGWSRASGLGDESLSWTEFRQIIHDAHYATHSDYRASGRAAGEMRRFVWEMQPGSLVVVPHGSQFYVAKVTGEFRRLEDKVDEDTAHRRSVEWLNDGQPIHRSQAPARLYSRMKIRGTSASASDLVEEINAVLERQRDGQRVTFDSDLHEQLLSATVDRLRRGFVNEREFERIIREVLRRMGAASVRVVDNRRYDEGADVVATFRLGRTTEVVLAVQAKFFKPNPAVTPQAVEELITGMAAEGADLGWLVSTGTFSADVEAKRDELLEEKGPRIELIDAEELAVMILENGVSPPPAAD